MKIRTFFVAGLIATAPMMAMAPSQRLQEVYAPEAVGEFDPLFQEWIQYEADHPGWNSELLFDAVLFAAERHEGQFRKGDHLPYIVHPLRVARLLWSEGDVRSANILAAAILHDTIEDTETSEAELVERFGSRVAATVMEVSDDQSLPASEKKRLQVEHARTMSHDAQLVKMADRIDNLRDMGSVDWSDEKKATYRYWGRELGTALTGAHPQLEAILAEVSAQ